MPNQLHLVQTRKLAAGKIHSIHLPTSEQTFAPRFIYYCHMRLHSVKFCVLRTQIQERTLKACDWLSGAGPGLISGLEDQDPMSESGAGVGKWDQFEANKDLKVNDVTYNENTMSNFYTTSLSPAAVTE